ncbi:ribbon-helix-helix protein, CopG family [Burkholderia diffusa]|uniref:ribbon-helix-helix protein, CopG family n=1 Tax=Burkholderia diffusa TaxID=488732 RepID=UPI001FC8B41D|nr:ribbon-helix-helix protein, CopG family [Burkholderia diffusa]
MPAASAIDTFIQGAPDARSASASGDRTGSVPGGRQVKRKISVDIDPDLLARLDEAARATGISRNAALAIGAASFLSETESRRSGR